VTSVHIEILILFIVANALMNAVANLINLRYKQIKKPQQLLRLSFGSFINIVF